MLKWIIGENMLDKLNSKLLKVLNEQCIGANYKVLEISDILIKMKKFKLDEEGLKKNLEFLQERNFVDLKYFDENEICLSILPKGRVHNEEVEEEKKEKIDYYKLAIISSLGSAIFAFLGGFLAFILLK